MTKEIKPTISKSKARKARRTRERFAQSTPTLKVDYSYPDRNRGKKIHFGATAAVPGETTDIAENQVTDSSEETSTPNN